MKETGIVRRIDDLGRVVVPKELHYKLGIREGDALEILYDDDMVCFRKYNVEGLFASALNKVVDMFNDEEVSQCLSPEEKIVIKSMIDFLLKKRKQSEDTE
jgi:AbrB family looped-hinge helix DNA binding protein